MKFEYLLFPYILIDCLGRSGITPSEQSEVVNVTTFYIDIVLKFGFADSLLPILSVSPWICSINNCNVIKNIKNMSKNRTIRIIIKYNNLNKYTME